MSHENALRLKIYHLLELYNIIMKRRVILLIILIITLLSGMSLMSLLWYFDPYVYRVAAVLLWTFCFIWFIWGWVTLILYFVKKIYYRWDIGIYHVLSSMRQAFLFSLMILWIVYVIWLWIPILLPIILIIALIIFFELFIQNL